MPNEAFDTGLDALTASAFEPSRRKQIPRPELAAPCNALFVLRETPCPYLPGRFERKLVAELPPNDTAFYTELSRAGFRRSHRFAYRPACSGCEACVPVRIPVARFRPSRSQKRIARRNADLTVWSRAAKADVEQYELFLAYLQARHSGGEMASMAYADYRAMIEDTVLQSRMIELRDGENRLRAACLVDWLEDGPSAVYSFFDPSEPDRSLGTEIILRLVRETRSRELPVVYLGYWIANSPKMAYKARFRPLEALGPDGWRLLPDTTSHEE
ncbi:arginyltransferase [Algihabitans albus]|uniref:arginyltransferase n=1 Tax=Algihabitans albus TaxID=2164067 RepID=UPI000E5CE75F|nr:arginyltransferase [Algihabitans albus]